MWAMPVPYDKLDVIITLPASGGGTTDYEFTYQGNCGITNQYFDNPNTTLVPINITVKARVICNPYSNPMDMGAQRTVTVSVVGPSYPIARNDAYTISAGYGIAVTLSPSVMANDTDPDGDALEVIPQSGLTWQMGAYTIDAAGIVTYTPPTSAFTGQDIIFNYTLRKVLFPSLTCNALIFINVASGIIPVWAKIIDTGTGSARTVSIFFYSNSAGTVAVDVTGFGLTINYTEKYIYYNGKMGNNTRITPLSINASGTSNIISTGKTSAYTYFLQTGTGYTPI
jgi:hypothetical protein